MEKYWVYVITISISHYNDNVYVVIGLFDIMFNMDDVLHLDLECETKETIYQ